MNFSFLKRKEEIITFEYNYDEKFILCNCIENYIEIAKNTNNKDDYFSVIALIYMFRKQYPEYIEDLNVYLDKFHEENILEDYYFNETNIAKKMFTKYGTNPKKAREYLFGFVNGCNSRFMSYLVMIGLCGRPTTPLSRFVLATIYNYNSSIFCKQAIYYTNLYLNNKLCESEYKKDLRGEKYAKNSHLIFLYKYLGTSYERNKEYNNSLKCYELSNSLQDIMWLQIRNKKYKEANKTLNKLLISNKSSIYKKINLLSTKKYIHNCIKYPYIQKELREIINNYFKSKNITIEFSQKDFNNLNKKYNITNNKKFCKNKKYSKKSIEYIQSIIEENLPKI